MAEKPADFKADLEALFPDGSTKRAGRMLDISQRSVQRWVTEGGVPENVDAAMKTQVEALHASGLVTGIPVLVCMARTAGVHDEVIAAHLDHVARSLLGRDIP